MDGRCIFNTIPYSMGCKVWHKILTKDIEENLIKILNKIVDDSNFRILEDYIESIKESINIAFLNTEYQRYIVH